MTRLRLGDLQRIIRTTPKIVLLGSMDRRIAAMFLLAPLASQLECEGTIITTTQMQDLWRRFVKIDCYDTEGDLKYGPYLITTARSGDRRGRVAIVDIGVPAEHVREQISGMDYVIALDPSHVAILGYPEYHIQDAGGDQSRKKHKDNRHYNGRIL